MYPHLKKHALWRLTEPKITGRYMRLLFNEVSKLDTKERYWGQQFCRFGPTRPVKVDHLQSWSPMFRSDQLNIHSVPFDVTTKCRERWVEILGDLWWRRFAEMLVQSVGSEWPFKITRYILLISPSENHTILARATQITIFFNGQVYKFPLSLSLYFSHSAVCLFFFIPMSIKRKRSAWMKIWSHGAFLCPSVRR